MASEWSEELTFAELIEEGSLEIGDGYRARNEELGGEGLIFLRAGHVTDSHIDFSGVERFHADLASRVQSKMSMPGDAIVTTKGNSTGRTAFVTSSMPPFVYSPHLSYWRSKDLERVDSGFLRYWSRGDEFGEQLAAMKASTDMAPYLSLIDQKRLRISLPNIGEQRAIAHILGTLDDKIELNRRMSETLEAMARALFKSWFVDFDPVRAKAEGREPGLPKRMVALFPSRLLDSELGEIPEGWDCRTWGDLVSLEYGKSLRNYESSTGNFPVFGTNGRIGSHDVALCPFPGIVVGRKGAYRGIHYSHEPFFVIDTAFYVLPKSRLQLRWAYYEMLRLDLNGMDSGSAIPSTSREEFYSLPVVVPNVGIQDEYVATVGVMWDKQIHLANDSRLLSSLRDVLLPKLISGEVRVKDAERFVEHVA